MKLINTIVLLLLLIIGGIILLPVLGAGVAILLLFGGTLIWLLPIALILLSQRASNLEKLLWILAIIFLSWFAWILYFLLAPLLPNERPTRQSW